MATLGHITWRQTQKLRWTFGLIISHRYLTSVVSILNIWYIFNFCGFGFYKKYIYTIGFVIGLLSLKLLLTIRYEMLF